MNSNSVGDLVTGQPKKKGHHVHVHVSQNGKRHDDDVDYDATSMLIVNQIMMTTTPDDDGHGDQG